MDWVMNRVWMEKKRLGMVALAVLAWPAMGAAAQDMRQVAEPKIPASCVQLSAQLMSVKDKVAEADERKLDTGRIQAALDKCSPGMAVELKPASGNNAFLTGAAGVACWGDSADR